MEASIFTKPQHQHDDEGEEGDNVWSELETLKKLYGLVDANTTTATPNYTQFNNEEILDHKSRLYLMKLLDEATQQTIRRRQMKVLPGSLLTHQLANISSSLQRFGRCDLLNDNDGNNNNNNNNNSLRGSVHRRDSNSKLILKSQFSIKSRQSQTHCAPTQLPSHPYHHHHPMSRYLNSRSGISIDDSSKHDLIGEQKSPMSSYHQYHHKHEIKWLYCPSQLHSGFNANYKSTVEMTPKRILLSPRDRTTFTPSHCVRLDRVSSRFKFQNQNMATTKDSSSNHETACSSELHSSIPDQRRRMAKFDKRTAHINNSSSPINCKKKSGDDKISVDSSSQSNSVTSSATGRHSSSSSRGSQLGALPIVPFQKPAKFPATARTKKPLISQHEHNKSLQRIRSTRHKFVSSRRNSKKLTKESDMPEQKKRRFKRLKDKLAIVFHHRHDHHHYHHHDASGDGSTKGQAARADKDHHHRSLWKYLKGMVHHSSEQAAEIVPSQHQHQHQQHHHRHMRTLFHMLFSHLWGSKRRKKAGVGRRASRARVKKVRWWHKLGRMNNNNNIINGRKARLRLRNGGSMMNKINQNKLGNKIN